MEVMFYIIAGKFNPSNDDFPVKMREGLAGIADELIHINTFMDIH